MGIVGHQLKELPVAVLPHLLYICTFCIMEARRGEAALFIIVMGLHFRVIFILMDWMYGVCEDFVELDFWDKYCLDGCKTIGPKGGWGPGSG